MSQAKDSVRQTIIVTVVLCLVCSVLVSGAAVILKPKQMANASLDRKKNILESAGLMEPGRSVEELFSGVEARVVDLNSGDFVEVEDASEFNQRVAAKNPETSVSIPRDKDVAGIGRRSNLASVYIIRSDDGSIENVILPVHGYGLWSTMYGFLALEGDGNTVVGFKFYEHGETPGLGGEVDNPLWRDQWPGKQVYDEKGRPAAALVKGGVVPDSPAAKHAVDALSGATLTSRGVTNLLRYWLGEEGFGPFLTKLRTAGGNSGEA